jgi:hypothetical protein
MQMALRQVQIDGRILDVGVSQQQLNGTQIGAGLQQMCGIGMAERVRADLFLNACPSDRALTGVPDGLGRKWSARPALSETRK